MDVRVKDRFKERIISDRKGFRTLEKFQEALPALLVEFPERDPQFGVTHHLCQYILSGHGERLPVPLRIHCFVLFQFSSFSASVDKKVPQTAGHADNYLSTSAILFSFLIREILAGTRRNVSEII